MGRRVVNMASLTGIANKIREKSGLEAGLTFPGDFESGVDEVFTAGYRRGYEEGLAEASDTNLFHLDTVAFYAKSASNKVHIPKITDGIYYPAGLIGDHDGRMGCVPVRAGDIITFSATFACDSRSTLIVGAGSNPVDDVFTSYLQLATEAKTGAFHGTRCLVVVIPEGYEWFGFTVIGATAYNVALTDIRITRQNNPLGEQAAAYNILMGVAE